MFFYKGFHSIVNQFFYDGDGCLRQGGCSFSQDCSWRGLLAPSNFSSSDVPFSSSDDSSSSSDVSSSSSDVSSSRRGLRLLAARGLRQLMVGLRLLAAELQLLTDIMVELCRCTFIKQTFYIFKDFLCGPLFLS